MPRTSSPNKATPAANSDDDGLVWGLKNIGAEIGRTEEQAQYLHARGLLDGIVYRLGPKTLVARRAKLRKFPEL